MVCSPLFGARRLDRLAELASLHGWTRCVTCAGIDMADLVEVTDQLLGPVDNPDAGKA
jgi:hypothetical protein